MNYNRINKSLARKMYRDGYAIFLLPCKCSDLCVTDINAWVKPVIITSADENADLFDRRVNDFEFYNCNSELGYYSHYYASVEDIIRFKSEEEKYSVRVVNPPNVVIIVG